MGEGRKKRSARFYLLLGFLLLPPLLIGVLVMHNAWRFKIWHSLAPTSEATDAMRDMTRNRQLLTEFAAQGKDPRRLYKSVALLPALDDLGIVPGAVIADIGAGTGALEVRLLTENVPFGRIYAVDLDEPSLAFLRLVLEVFEFPGEERVTPVVNRLDSVELEPQTVDLVTIINCRLGMRSIDNPMPQSDIEERDRLYQSLRAAMKPNARVVLIAPLREANFHKYPEQYLLEPFFANGFCLEERRIDWRLFPQYYYAPFRYYVMVFIKQESPARSPEAVCG